jgi:two-component system, LuxR family, sensor kinase FixL
LHVNPINVQYTIEILKTLVENAVDGIIIIDEMGKIQMVNPSACIMFGYRSEELTDNSINMLMPSFHAERHDGYILQYIDTGIKNIIGVGREVEGLRKDGSLFPFDLSISELFPENGRRLFVGTVHDISKQKEIQMQVEESNIKLEERIAERTNQLAKVVNRLLQANAALRSEVSERKAMEDALRVSREESLKALENEKILSELKSRFITTASHEFRTPLSSILSSAKIIGRYTDSEGQEKRQKHIRRIESAVRNLTNILSDLLTWSKLEENKAVYRPVEFCIIELFKEVLEEAEALSKTGQLFIYSHKGDTSNVTLDPIFIKNILINLLSNAVKYSPENKSIHISTIIENERLQLSVKDEGLGIPIDEQPLIFNRFFRANNVDSIPGTGLGLNIVRKYLDSMGGAIYFESEPEKGTVFHVTIPTNCDPANFI